MSSRGQFKEKIQEVSLADLKTDFSHTQEEQITGYTDFIWWLWMLVIKLSVYSTSIKTMKRN